MKKRDSKIDMRFFLSGLAIMVFGFTMTNYQISVLISAIGGMFMGLGIRNYVFGD